MVGDRQFEAFWKVDRVDVESDKDDVLTGRKTEAGQSKGAYDRLHTCSSLPALQDLEKRDRLTVCVDCRGRPEHDLERSEW